MGRTWRVELRCLGRAGAVVVSKDLVWKKTGRVYIFCDAVSVLGGIGVSVGHVMVRRHFREGVVRRKGLLRWGNALLVRLVWLFGRLWSWRRLQTRPSQLFDAFTLCFLGTSLHVSPKSQNIVLSKQSGMVGVDVAACSTQTLSDVMSMPPLISVDMSHLP